jgi:NAD-dependent deacetylase
LTGGGAGSLAGLVREHQPCVVLTGAGVSTESGVPDFRSAGGIWSRYDPLDVASIEAFERDPARVWEFYGRRLELLADVAPNAGHHALAELEQAGFVRAVITQNVDGLHARAGSQEVIEVHGSASRARCVGCGRVVSREEVRALLPLPRCDVCGSVLKPDVVLFGELLPEEPIDRATTLAREAGVLLIVGSSLQVWPVAGLPEETLRHGGRLAVVNREPTPYDLQAEVVVHDSAGVALSALRDTLV